MEETGLVDFACKASRALGNAIRDLTSKHKTHADSPKWMDFAARLITVAEVLDQPRAGSRVVTLEKIFDYLSDLEKICRWPETLPRARQPVAASHYFERLQSIQHRRGELNELVLPLKHLFQGAVSVHRLLRKMDKMSLIPRTNAMSTQVPEAEMILDKSEVCVYNDVHKALARHSLCTCTTAMSRPQSFRQHRGRLKLMREHQHESDQTALDAVFTSSASHGTIHVNNWAYTRVFVEGTSKVTGRLQWADDKKPITTGRPIPSHRIPIALSSAFCKVFLRHLGPVCHELRIRDGEIEAMSDTLYPVLKFPRDSTSSLSISLADMLKVQKLSDDAKLLLSYTLSHSVWKFYDTHFKQRRWDATDYHFMLERAGPGSAGEHSIRPLHCFVPMDFDPPTEKSYEGNQEYAPGQGLLHWAPRMFALGMVLVYIFADEALPEVPPDTTWKKRINDDYIDCDQVLNDPRWPRISIQNTVVRQTLKEAVAACLDGNTFKNTADAWERKSILYRQVVLKLLHVTQIAHAQDANATWLPKDDRVTGPVSLQTASEGSKALSNAVYTGNQARDHSRQLNGNVIVHGNYYEGFLPIQPNLDDPAAA